MARRSPQFIGTAVYLGICFGATVVALVVEGITHWRAPFWASVVVALIIVCVAFIAGHEAKWWASRRTPEE